MLGKNYPSTILGKLRFNVHTLVKNMDDRRISASYEQEEFLSVHTRKSQIVE